jgi:hypothetical protein
MEIRIVLSDRIINAVTRIVTRRRAMMASAVLLTLFSTVAVADPVQPQLTVFQSGDVISSSEVNENFSLIAQQVDSNSALLAAVNEIEADGKRYSLNGVYRGTTESAVIGGSFGSDGLTQGAIQYGGESGYPAAKAACEVAVGNSPTAHMCTAEELVRSAQLGISVPTGVWYSGGVAATRSDDYVVWDCNRWTSLETPCSAASHCLGYTWGQAYQGCSSALPVACCDH